METRNCCNGEWLTGTGAPLDVLDPATGEVLAQVAQSTAGDVDEAVLAAQDAFLSWRRTPATERIQYLFRYKQLLEQGIGELAEIISRECGKTVSEARGELRAVNCVVELRTLKWPAERRR